MPGTRVPHCWVNYQGQKISTLDVVGKGFVLLTGSDGERWRKDAAMVAIRLGIDLTVYRIGPDGELRTPKRHWHAAAGISSQGAVLVRPDGFVAWRSRKQPDNLQQTLEGVLLRVLCRA